MVISQKLILGSLDHVFFAKSKLATKIWSFESTSSGKKNNMKERKTLKNKTKFVDQLKCEL